MSETPAITGLGICSKTICGKIEASNKNIKLADFGSNPKINLANGRFIFEHNDLSIGGENFSISISHIYNYNPTNYYSCGKSFKLNIQEKLIKINDSIYNIVDSIGDSNLFILLDSASSRYYNPLDPTKILTVPITGCPYIVDGLGNKTYFNNRGNIDHIVSGINSNIVKTFEYDINGRVTKVFDERLRINNEIKSFILFSYYSNTNLLESIVAYDNYNTKKYGVLFEYDDFNLIRIKRAAYNDNGILLETKTIKEFSYNHKGRLYSIIDTETRSASLMFYDSYDRISEVNFGVIDDMSNPDNTSIVLGAGIYVSKGKNTYTYYLDSDGSTYETDIKNEDDVITAFYLDSRCNIVSKFERTASNSVKTLSKERGKKLTISCYNPSVIYSGKLLNGDNTYTVNQCEFSINDSFNLSHYEKNDNKYFECSFWIKHDLDVDRLKIKVEYKLTNDINYREDYAWINGNAKGAYQRVSTIITLDEENGSFNSKSLKAMRISLCYASGINAGSFDISYLLFNPSSFVSFCANSHALTNPLPIRDVETIVLNDEVYINNLTSDSLFLTEDDIMRSLMNKYIRDYPISGHVCFDLICNGGTKLMPNVYKLVFVHGNINCDLTRNDFHILVNTILSNNKIKISQNYHFQTSSFKISSYNYFYENGIGGLSSENDHYTTCETKYNYRGQKLSETDEYNIKTINTYNSYGELIKTEKTTIDGANKEVSDITYANNNENIKTVSSGFESRDYNYISPSSINNETIANSYNSSSDTYVNTTNKTKSIYNSYFDRITRVEEYDGNNVVASNDITYENGRIRTVSDGYCKFGQIHDFINDIVTYTQFQSPSSSTEDISQTDSIEKVGTNKIHKSTFNGNSNNSISTIVDKYDRVLSVKEGTNEKVSYDYIESSESTSVQNVSTIYDAFEQLTTTFNYDLYNNLYGFQKGNNHLKIEQIASGDTKYTFGSNEKYFSHIAFDNNKVISPRISSTGMSRDLNNDSDDDLDEMKEYRKNYTYDFLGRLIKKKVNDVYTESDKSLTSEQNIEYLDIGSNKTKIPRKISYSSQYSEWPSQYSLTGVTRSISQEESYSYDNRGRLSSIQDTITYSSITTHTQTGPYYYGPYTITQTKSYTYDNLNRITSEKDTIFGDKTYVYGSNGKLDYITEGARSYFLSYNSKNQISFCRGVYFTYDNMGNRSSMTINNTTTDYSYTRGNLLSNVGSDISYYYNKDGVRFKKIVNNTTTIYYLDGNKILGESRSDGTEIRYFYDIDGLSGIRYNSTNYEYVRNAFGDIIMITKDGALICEYFYDAFGNCKVFNSDRTENTSSSFIGNINPFRWKSHYLDTETNLYYANGSYYDPSISEHVDAVRFSSIIDNAFIPFSLNPNGIMCNNIFGYIPNTDNIETSQELSVNPAYDINANKPWWETMWTSMLRWFYDLNPLIKIGFGITLFALAVLISIKVHDGLNEAIPFIVELTIAFFVGVTGKIYSSINNAITNNESIPDAFIHGLADGILFGGVFALIISCINALRIIRYKRIKTTGTPNVIGRNGEEYISQITGLSKNRESIGINGRNRIPDFVDKDKKILIESKNVARQSMTRQLKDYVIIAKNNGWKMEMYIRHKTILTKTIDDFITIKYFPW